jgi:hypothetical protein
MVSILRIYNPQGGKYGGNFVNVLMQIYVRKKAEEFFNYKVIRFGVHYTLISTVYLKQFI